MEEFSSHRVLTSSEESALAPIHGQQDPRPETDALREVHAPPQVHGHQAAAETQPVEVEHGRVANVREAAQVVVLERFIHGFVHVAVVDFVGGHAGDRLRQLVELAAQVLPLLVGALGGGGEGSQFRIDLEQELVEFAELEGSVLL